jgi:hypothetical protein
VLDALPVRCCAASARRTAVLSNVALLNTVSEQGTTLPLIAARAIATDSTGKTVDDASRMIALLLQNRCDVNGCTDIGWTLLHEASSERQLQRAAAVAH